MNFFITYYLSTILGKSFYDQTGETLGKIKDVVVAFSVEKPKIIAIEAKTSDGIRILDFSFFDIRKTKDILNIYCNELKDYTIGKDENILYLSDNILDKQIIDINGRKLVRANDVRLVRLKSGSFAVAVDVGLEGILRRLGVEKPIGRFLKMFNTTIPGRYILFDDVEAVDFTTSGITLSKAFAKLKTLHPSDLADVIEELDQPSRKVVFESLDNEKAADVLEELEPDAQVDMIESLTLEKAADVLEKMPADEAADLIDELEEHKQEELLNEIEKESSDDIRDILSYEDDTVGTLMMTEFIAFHPEATVDETINHLRKIKPESETTYYLYILDKKNRLIGTVSLRDLVIADPDMILYDIMKRPLAFVYDTDELDSIADIIQRYNLLAIPVVNKNRHMEGVVIIDDIVEDLLNKRRTE